MAGTSQIIPDAMKPLGSRLREVRLDCRLSIAEVAAQLPGEVSGNYLSQIETGKIPNPSAERLRALACLYGVSMDYLVGLPQRPLRRQEVELVTVFRKLSPKMRQVILSFARHLARQGI